jgi:ribosome-associated translation inhibitor RaiA
MTMLENLTELYWSLGEYSIDDRRRMKAVVHEISHAIRTWAPDPGQAKICYLAINEVADRLIRECEKHESTD